MVNNKVDRYHENGRTYGEKTFLVHLSIYFVNLVESC